MPPAGIEVGSEKTLYIVDISSFIFRAFFAIRVLNNKKGEPTNAVYGVASMLAKLIEEAAPAHLVVAYDSREPSFRKEIFKDYKANRSAPPDDLVPQFARIDELIKKMGIPSCRVSGVEADDLIASIAKKWKQKSAEHQVVIVTGDKDLMQLVDHRTTVWDTMKDKVFDSKGVEEKFGIGPEKMRDYLAMVGDSSDNVPGLPGIGSKTATSLLQEHGTLEKIFVAAEAGNIKGKKAQTITDFKETARLASELVSLKDDLSIEMDQAEEKFEFRVDPLLVDFLLELDFRTLVDRWRKLTGKNKPQEPIAADSKKVVAPTGDWKFHSIQDSKEFEKLIGAIQDSGVFAIDLETTSLNPREAEIVGIAVSYRPKEGFYIPLKHAKGTQLPSATVLKSIKPLLENSKIGKIGQNLKYDWSVFRENGIVPAGILADTMVAAYLLDPAGRNGLDFICSKYLDYTPLTYKEVCGEGKSEISFSEVEISTATRYAAEDAACAFELWNILKGKLDELGLMKIFEEVDLPLVEVLTKMECEGVCLDVDWLKGLSEQFQRQISEIEKRIEGYTEFPINLNSTKQIAKLLFDDLGLPTQAKTKKKTGYSTDVRVLQSLSHLHEVPRLLLEYREISKLKGTYVDPLPLLLDKKTGKIHAGFHQTVTATGRLSSSDPNLQNIPVKTERGKLIRRAFVPSPGNLLLSADYSQVELRILAHMSGDPVLSESFRNGEDIHLRTACEIFGVKPSDVDDTKRAISKAINFGLMYGKSAFGLSQELKISRAEAKEFIDRYFSRYRAVKEFLDSLIQQVKEKGYVKTVMGRRRDLPEIASRNAMVRANAERMAMNTPIQGTAADLMKLAMIRVDRKLDEARVRSRLTIQVHDELLLDCPEGEVEQVQKMVVSEMENAMSLKVPLKVNSYFGKNWMDI